MQKNKFKVVLGSVFMTVPVWFLVSIHYADSSINFMDLLGTIFYFIGLYILSRTVKKW